MLAMLTCGGVVLMGVGCVKVVSVVECVVVFDGFSSGFEFGVEERGIIGVLWVAWERSFSSKRG